ncbi:MAG: response regulator [Sulfurimonas sp.]|nr:response regulator [Sulfurimonas sp.]
MEAINQYLIESIAGIILIIFLSFYFLFKKPKKKKIITSEEKVKETSPVSEQVKEPLELKEEEKEEVVSQEEPIIKTHRIKREIIPHEKIQKDDFAIFKNIKILIAEDNFINQKVITSFLAGSHIHITIANDGQECLDILEQDSNFSIIFMDAHMPIVDGFEATRLIRKNLNYDHIPVIALSGDTASDDIKLMLDSGMEGHIEKPLKMGSLFDMLYIYTTGKESQKEPITQNNLVEELNTKKGLDICGGDKEFYLEILNDFTSKYSNSAHILQNELNHTNADVADKLLLDISGIAANIGADELYEISLKLKESLRSATDLEYISDLKNYKRSLHSVCEAIKKYKTS